MTVGQRMITQSGVPDGGGPFRLVWVRCLSCPKKVWLQCGCGCCRDLAMTKTFDPDKAVTKTYAPSRHPEPSDASLLKQLDANSEEYNEKLRQLQSVLDPSDQPDLYTQPARVNHSVLDIPWPRIFSDYAYLQSKVEAYFSQCDEDNVTYTLPDLAYALGFSAKKGLDLILKQAHIFPASAAVLQKALLRIEGQRNRQLVDGQGQMTGRVLDLKVHHGWDDGSQAKEQGSVNIQQNVYNNTLNAMPPEPKDMNEWVQWYQQQMGSRQKAGDNLKLEGESAGDDTIDVSSIPDEK